MGRPSAFDRQNAVEIAMNEIWRDGYKACSVKALSEKLGITRSSFYNAFGSREGFFQEVLAAYFAQSPDHVLHEDVAAGPIRALLTATFREICRVRASDPESRGCLAINCLCELKGGAQDAIGQTLAEMVIASAERMEALLSKAVARGELPESTDVHAQALALQSMLVGLNAMSKAINDETELWICARTMLQALDLYSGAHDVSARSG